MKSTRISHIPTTARAKESISVNILDIENPTSLPLRVLNVTKDQFFISTYIVPFSTVKSKLLKTKSFKDYQRLDSKIILYD